MTRPAVGAPALPEEARQAAERAKADYQLASDVQ